MDIKERAREWVNLPIQKCDSADALWEVLDLGEKVVTDLMAEVERLEQCNKALLEEVFTDHLTEAIQQGKEMATENMKLFKENKRYREALERIASDETDYPKQVAKEALEGGE